MASSTRLLAFALGSGFVLAGFFAQGCDEFLHPRPYNGPGGGNLYPDGGTSGDGGGDLSACSDCATQYCLTQAYTCLQDADCGIILSCVQGYCPPTAANIQACVNSDPAGSALYNTVRSCEQSATVGVCSSVFAGVNYICSSY